MEEKSKKNAQSQTISRKEARARVRKWLEVMGSLPEFKADPASIPRAIYIPFIDLQQMLEVYKEKDVKGIRVYFGLDELPGEPLNPTELRGMVVPVLYKDERHRDHIEEYENPDDTSIYDFTTPCPVYCDFDSELFVKYP